MQSIFDRRRHTVATCGISVALASTLVEMLSSFHFFIVCMMLWLMLLFFFSSQETTFMLVSFMFSCVLTNVYSFMYQATVVRKWPDLFPCISLSGWNQIWPLSSCWIKTLFTIFKIQPSTLNGKKASYTSEHVNETTQLTLLLTTL